MRAIISRKRRRSKYTQKDVRKLNLKKKTLHSFETPYLQTVGAIGVASCVNPFKKFTRIAAMINATSEFTKNRDCVLSFLTGKT